jgi:hypothetical protein
MNKTWIRTLSVLAIATFTTAALAQRNATTRQSSVLPAGTPNLGVFGPNGPGSAGGTTVIYDSTNAFFGSYYRPFIGYLDGDDTGTTFDNVQGGILEAYEITVFGSATNTNGADCPSEAALPYDVNTAIWRDDQSPPDVHVSGTPLSAIAGTSCSFVGLPKGATLTLSCPVSNVPVNGQYWSTINFSTDCAGWILGGTGAPAIGFSDDFWAEDFADGGATWTFYYFGGFPDAPYSNMLMTHYGHEAGPDACCNSSTDSCSNQYPGECQGADELYTEGVLCNDLPDLCSDAGACCDTLTGDCRASFASLCTGIFDEFTAGGDCSAITCEGGDNIPTVSQWGMLVLTAVLLTGLTIKFGRRRTATA